MKHSTRGISLLAVGIAVMVALPAHAQNPNLAQTRGPSGRVTQTSRGAQAPIARSAAGTRVAIIDISKVFQNHQRFKQLMDRMKSDVEAFEGTLKQRGAQMQQMRQELQDHRTGSEEYSQVEARITKFQASVQADTQLKRKEFLQREARIYFDVYNEVAREVAKFSQRAGIDIVLRYNSEPINPENRQSVLEGVNRAVVYDRGDMDITQDVLRRLNAGSALPTARTGSPGGVPRQSSQPRRVR